jgi:hypothetical protein
MSKSQFETERLREAKKHAAAIVALAGQADSLIAQVRQLVASMQEHERAASRALVQSGNVAHTGKLGQDRLALMAVERMPYPSDQPLPPHCGESIALIAAKAWADVLEGRL